MNRVHIAILKRPYVQAILAGTKTVESRLTRNAGPPFGLVTPGQRLYLKVSAGPFMATATAHAVHSFDHLAPPDIADLARRFEPRVAGGPDYWDAKRDSRFATFIELTDAEPIDVGPPYRIAHMRAWYALDAALDPVRDIPLTDGALRNGYLPLPADASQLRTQTVTLEFPDGSTIQTDASPSHRFRWRGWGRWYHASQLRPGDRVRLTALGKQRYRVQFRRS